ncbi:MAG: GTPase domain-containing protein [Mucilaginibacter sp.]|uniref:GTPase domain-containing protein n=1 Tax=Mucilaginibacter sp. TaxID=1882438 RepID=UPI0031A70A5F
MPMQEDGTFELLLSNILNEEELQSSMRKALISKSVIEERILPKKQEIWDTVISQLQEFDLTVIYLRDFQRDHPKIHEILHNSRPTYKLTILFVVLVFCGAAIIFFLPMLIFKGIKVQMQTGGFMWVLSNDWMLPGILTVFFTLFFFFPIFWVRKKILIAMFKRKRGEIQLANAHLIQDYRSKSEHLFNLNQLIKNSVTETMKDLIRDIINNEFPESYAIEFADVQANGLGEMIDASRTVDTDAKKKLQFLLNKMPGGSIGIAGSRGAGKSTLIKTFCGNTRSVREINDVTIIPVMTSAPVKYDARDFLLYLFSLTCENALKEAKVKLPENLRSDYQDEVASKFTIILSRILPFIFRLLLIAGLFLMFISFSVWRLHQQFHKGYRTELEYKFLSSSKPDTIKLKKERLMNAGRLDSLQKNRIASNFGEFYLSTISASPNSSVSFLNWGLFLITAALSFQFFQRRFALVRNAHRIIEKTIERVSNSLPPSENAYSIANEAETWLRKIRFQQTFTEGWGGSLKLPIGIEGNRTGGRSMAEKPMTNPEIIEGFSKFLDSLAVHYQVIIGIDELDKLETDDTATQFLNEIKSIFGIQRCFFLVAVSENAMNSFERRGLPFRDVFDSSFDSIVFVNYLNLNRAKELLQKRMIGRPVPFWGLAYCFAGGLPRDIVRHFREILRLAEVGRNIETIAEKMIIDDASAKIRATMNALRKLQNLTEASEVFAMLFVLQPERFTKAILTGAISGLFQTLRNMNTTIAQQGVEETNRTALMVIIEELGSYFGYLITLWDLFSVDLSEEKMKRLNDDGTLDRITMARQAFSIDYAIARTIISDCRNVEGLSTIF